MLFMTGEYETLTASTEKLRKKTREGAQGQVLFEVLGHVWDEHAFKAGANGISEQTKAYEIVVELICNVVTEA